MFHNPSFAKNFIKKFKDLTKPYKREDGRIEELEFISLESF